jgi:hypothetical protein
MFVVCVILVAFVWLTLETEEVVFEMLDTDEGVTAFDVVITELLEEFKLELDIVVAAVDVVGEGIADDAVCVILDTVLFNTVDTLTVDTDAVVDEDDAKSIHDKTSVTNKTFWAIITHLSEKEEEPSV